MNSRDVVRKTLDFGNPSRVARSFAGSDFVRANHTARTFSTAWRRVSENRWERTDEWGNTWARVDETSKGEVVKGVLDSLADLEKYVFPDFSDPADYAEVRRKRDEHPGKWLIGCMPGFTFNIANKLRKLENYLADLLLEPAAVARMHDRIDACLEEMIRNYAAAGADCVMFPEDWGTQKQTLISPALWRAEFFPRTQRLCALAHASGIRVFMHSCGRIGAIVPGLVEAGIDVLQFDQPELHGLDALAGFQASSPVTFWCPVDIQKILQTRDETLIRGRARAMLEKLWQGRGGFIAGYYEDNASIGLLPEWQGYAADEFLACGVSGRFRAAGY